MMCCDRIHETAPVSGGPNTAGLPLRSFTEAEESAAGPLRDLILQRLHERQDTGQIAVLGRTAPLRVLTGGELLAAAAAMAARWQEWLGQGPRRLVLVLPPGEAFLVALLAGLLGGYTIIPVSPPRQGARAGWLGHIVCDSGASGVLCVAGMTEAVLRQLHTADSGFACPVAVLDEVSHSVAPLAVPSSGPDGGKGPNPAVIMYTSGSTHLPKGVRIFGEQILANSGLVARSWDMNPETRFVNWLPHFHDMGLMGGILYPLLTGAYSIQLNPLDIVRRPAFWLRAISDHRASFSGGPAFAFADCLRRITPEECEGLDLSSWARAFCGAEPIPAGLLPAFRERFEPYGLRPDAVFGCYGMAEFTLFAAGMPEAVEALPPAPPYCAAVHPCRLADDAGVDIRIVDPERLTVLGDGEQGEIWLRGPSMGQGYVNLPEETDATFNAVLADTGEATWLRTGDLGVLCDARLYVTGRLKDTLIVNGRKIAAPEIEWLAAELDDALNPLAAAAFLPNQADGDAAVLLIELKPGRPAPEDPEAVCMAIKRAVMGEWGIRLDDLRILPRGTLERTSSGKVRRNAVADAYRAGGFGVAEAGLPMTGGRS